MKTMIASVFASLIWAFAVFSQGEGQATDGIVKALDKELTAALVKGDPATVDRILGDDYVEVTRQGLLRNKGDVMALVRARESAPKAIGVGPEVSVNEIKLHIYGNVAVLVGLMTTKYQHMEYQVSPGSGEVPPTVADQERFMRVYTRRAGRWQLVASQATGVTAVVSSPKSASKI